MECASRPTRIRTGGTARSASIGGPRVRIGSAASPRWFDLSQERLEEFIAALLEWGATATELVLHAGEADEATARVHILEPDWDDVATRFQTHGLLCHVHAPLHPRFKLDRWLISPPAFRETFTPVLDAVNRFASLQSEPCVLVVHAPSVASGRAEQIAGEFAIWAANRLRTTHSKVAFELRQPAGSEDQRFDRSRASITRFVESLDDPRIGICWDIAHDWQGRSENGHWTEWPDEQFLHHVLHVHVHGAGVFDGKLDVHFPLQSGHVPWQQMLTPLLAAGYHGAITIEARYRYARALGEPWTMLQESYLMLSRWLTERDAHLSE